MSKSGFQCQQTGQYDGFLLAVLAILSTLGADQMPSSRDLTRNGVMYLGSCVCTNSPLTTNSQPNLGHPCAGSQRQRSAFSDVLGAKKTHCKHRTGVVFIYWTLKTIYFACDPTNFCLRIPRTEYYFGGIWRCKVAAGTDIHWIQRILMVILMSAFGGCAISTPEWIQTARVLLRHSGDQETSLRFTSNLPLMGKPDSFLWKVQNG